MHKIRLSPTTDKRKEAGPGNAQPTVMDVALDSLRPIAPSLMSSASTSQGAFEQDQVAEHRRVKAPSVSHSQTASLKNGTSQASSDVTRAQRFIVIHAATKRKKKVSAADTLNRHMNPHLRQAIVLLTTLIILGVTLFTLIPLSPGTNGFPLASGWSKLISSARTDWQIIAQTVSQPSSATNAGLPPITIPRSQLVATAEQDATNAGISPTYFVRQITLESGFNPNAVSPGGAEGIAQFEPSTAAGLGINPFNPIQALNAAAQMMARYYHQYGDYAKALAGYNAGPATLQNAENSCGSNWLSCMPAQTQHYVSVIMGI